MSPRPLVLSLGLLAGFILGCLGGKDDAAEEGAVEEAAAEEAGAEAVDTAGLVEAEPATPAPADPGTPRPAVPAAGAVTVEMKITPEGADGSPPSTQLTFRREKEVLRGGPFQGICAQAQTPTEGALVLVGCWWAGSGENIKVVQGTKALELWVQSVAEGQTAEAPWELKGTGTVPLTSAEAKAKSKARAKAGSKAKATARAKAAAKAKAKAKAKARAKAKAKAKATNP